MSFKKFSFFLRTIPFLTTVILSTNGELTANALNTATLPLFFLTVNLLDTEPPLIDVTIPSKA